MKKKIIVSTRNVKCKWIDFFFLRSGKTKNVRSSEREIKILWQSMKMNREKKNEIYCWKCSFNCKRKTFCRIEWAGFIVQWRKAEKKNWLGTMDCNWSCVAIVRPEFRIRSMRNDKRMVSKIYSCSCCTLHAAECQLPLLSLSFVVQQICRVLD